MKRSLTDYPLAGKRVLVRVDFNVPLEDGRVVDDTRIRAALPTIQYLLDQGCSVVLMSHLGRPKGQVVDGLRMAPVAARLAELLGRPVATADDCVGPAAAQAAAALRPGDVLLLENLRFHAEETGNDAGVRAAAGVARRRLRQRRVRHGAPGARLHRGRHALPALGRRPAHDQGARGPRAPAPRPVAAVRRGPRRPQGLRQDQPHPAHAHHRRHGAHRRRHGQRVPRRQGLRGRRVQGRRGRGHGGARDPGRGRTQRTAGSSSPPTWSWRARRPPARPRASRPPTASPPTRWRSTSARRPRRSSCASCAAPGPSTGTAPWACSRSRSSPPARAPSARPSPAAPP